MSRGPKLPKALLDQVEGGRVSKRRKDIPRKDRRKQERLERKTGHRNAPAQRRAKAPTPGESDDDSLPPSKSRVPRNDTKPTKSILKQRPTKVESESEDDDEDDEEEIRPPALSKAVKAKLEDDDDEIAALEKKLGLKSKKSKKTGDDELDWLVYGSDGEDDENSSKRKRPEDDEWLRNKRRKAQRPGEASEEDESDEDGLEDDDLEDALGDLENPFSEDELSADGGDDFEGFEDEDDGEDIDMDEDEPAAAPKKENPYVPPVSKDAPPAKYVPPSLRKAAGSDEELLKQLRRQLQGQLNRLSEANMLSILQSVQEFYSNNARQHVTSTLVELLRNLICDPSVLNDTFLILHAGFTAALYRTIGIDFAAQMLEAIVQSFDSHYASASEGKQTLNLIAFLSNLYAFQLVGSEIMFDYIRMLLDKENFSEKSTELLLRVIRMSGTQLRQDNPLALKDIVLLLQRTVAAIGQANVSVRTKFMIETIQDLKNNRMKTGVSASALTAEHMQRMKKTLGTIKNPKTSEPLRISLTDIRDSEKKGKWWLVGASYKDPAKMASNGTQVTPPQVQQDNGAESDGADSDVDLDKLARSQGMNTDVRRAIFISVTGAVDYQHAHMRIRKLNLKKKQLLEVPRVLVHCVGAEPAYNHFYTLVATQFCGDHQMRKAYQFVLLDIFRRLGENRDGADDKDYEASGEEEMGVKKIYSIAKMYAYLVAEGMLRITILKPLNFARLGMKTRVFVEVLLTTLFNLLRKKAHKDGYEKSVKDTFAQAHAIPEMVPGLKYYVSSVVAVSELATDKKEKKRISTGCEFAVETLGEQKVPVAVEDDLSDED